MPKYEVVEVIRRYYEVEAIGRLTAYDAVIDGDKSTILVDEEISFESAIEIKENN
jgi:hypothetical protein